MWSAFQSCCHLGGLFALRVALTGLLVPHTYLSRDENIGVSLGTCTVLDKKCRRLSFNSRSHPDRPVKTFKKHTPSTSHTRYPQPN